MIEFHTWFAHWMAVARALPLTAWVLVGIFVLVRAWFAHKSLL